MKGGRHLANAAKTPKEGIRKAFPKQGRKGASSSAGLASKKGARLLQAAEQAHLKGAAKQERNDCYFFLFSIILP